jgi:hypothetical protein
MSHRVYLVAATLREGEFYKREFIDGKDTRFVGKTVHIVTPNMGHRSLHGLNASSRVVVMDCTWRHPSAGCDRLGYELDTLRIHGVPIEDVRCTKPR